MPLPSVVQTTDTFNNWLDATNNVISHIGNTSAYIQVAQNGTPSTSVGNTDLNGVATVTQLATTGNVVLGGSGGAARGNTIACTAPVFLLTTTASAQTISLLATNLSISVTNTVISGASLSIAPNTTLNGAITTIAGNASFSSSNAVFSGAKISTTANAQFTGANVAFTGTRVIVTANTEFQSTTMFGGPVLWNSLNIDAKSISGGGISPPLSVDANATILRVTTTDNTNVIAGIVQSNTAQYRHLTVFNVGANAVYFQHGNTSAGANGIYCPGNTNFMIPGQGAILLYYDANTSVQRWRVMSAPIGVDDLANTSISGYVGYTGSQTFGGDKTFQNTVSVTANFSVINATSATLTASIANSTSNVQITPRTITFEGTTTINSVSYTGTATNATNLNSQPASYYTNAANLSTGTLAIARLDSNVILTTTTTGINASALSVGTVPAGRLPSATTSANGAIDTAAQSFAGAKTFTANITVNGVATFANTVAINATGSRLVIPVGANLYA